MARAASGMNRNVNAALVALAGLTSKAGNKTELDRVFADPENDWDCRSGSFGGKCRRIAAGCGNDGNAAADEVSHERRQAIILPFQPVVFDRRVPAFDGSSLVEASLERSDIARRHIAATAADECDNRHCRLLRARSERTRGCTTERNYEIAPSHLHSPRLRTTMATLRLQQGFAASKMGLTAQIARQQF
jgi:hypothetical protein